MDRQGVGELEALLASSRVEDRLRAMDAISTKAGGRVVRSLDDPTRHPTVAEGDRRY